MSEARAPRITVLVADDHPVYREGWPARSRRGPSSSSSPRRATGARRSTSCASCRPTSRCSDVADAASSTATTCCTRSSATACPTRVVLLSAHVDSETVYRAVASGAGAYLSKESSRERICDAVAAVRPRRGRPLLRGPGRPGVGDPDPRARRAPGADPARARGARAHRRRATPRPTSASSCTSRQSTVKTHLKSLYDKLGVSDRAAAVAEAMRRGLLE